MNTKTKHISNQIRERINSVDPRAEVILYGSRARGDERSDSDWDILIITNYSIDTEKELAFRSQLYDLELELGEAISIFIYSKTDWETKQRITPFYQNVTHEGLNIK